MDVRGLKMRAEASKCKRHLCSDSEISTTLFVPAAYMGLVRV